VCHLVEELGRGKDFQLDPADGSSGRVAGAVFEDTHLPNKLARANGAEKDGFAIEFAEDVDSTAE
jgi:hypothetical protein